MGLAAAEFDYLCKFIHERSAIIIDPGKEYLVESRLTPLAYQEGLESAQKLLERLRRETVNGLHRKVLDAMTNNETIFFRDAAPFHALTRTIIPELLGKRSLERRLSLWSAAASSGQEAYSLAMLVCEEFAGLPGWEVSILGTDISEAILERARRGRYSQLEVNRGLPAKCLTKYFTREGVEWQISGQIRGMVGFRECNLAGSWPPLPQFDVIFLRNVLIYFSVEKKKEILRRARGVLREGGVLFLGSAETTLNLDDSFDRVPWENTSYYRLRK
jgi:chemotaxis protein methyltransferase CheR